MVGIAADVVVIVFIFHQFAGKVGAIIALAAVNLNIDTAETAEGNGSIYINQIVAAAAVDFDFGTGKAGGCCQGSGLIHDKL